MGVQAGKFPRNSCSQTVQIPSLELREDAVRALSDIIATRDVKEQIFLGITYEVADWVREGYVKISQHPKIQHKELSMNPFSLSWETIARIFAVRDNITPSTSSTVCCGSYHGTNSTTRHCRCKALALVKEEFKEELHVLEEFSPCPASPLPASKGTSPLYFGYSASKKRKRKK